MNKVIRLLVILSFIFWIISCKVADSPSQASKKPESMPAQQNSSKKPKVIAFGDSLTAGFGLPDKETYPYLLQERLKAEGYDYEVINAGVSGDTSGGGAERIEWSLEQDNVEVLILEIGGNDLLRGLSAKEMRQNVSEIIKKAKDKKVKVLLCGLFPPDKVAGAFQQDFAKVFPELAKEHSVAYMPFFLEGVGGKKEMNQADGIHPNAEGEKIITENVFKYLKPLLKK